jgi:hypothetical protein
MGDQCDFFYPFISSAHDGGIEAYWKSFKRISSYFDFLRQF